MAPLDIKQGIHEIKSSFSKVKSDENFGSNKRHNMDMKIGVISGKNNATNNNSPSLAIVIYSSEEYCKLNSVIEHTDYDYVMLLRREFVEDALLPKGSKTHWVSEISGEPDTLKTSKADTNDQTNDGVTNITILSSLEAVQKEILDANYSEVLLNKYARCNLDMLIFGNPQSHEEYCGLFSGQQFFVKTRTYTDNYCAQSWPPIIRTSFLKNNNIFFEHDSGLPEIAFGIKCITLAKRVMTCQNPFSETSEFSPQVLEPSQNLSIKDATSRAGELHLFIQNICDFINTQKNELENNFAKCLLRTLFECIDKMQQGFIPLDEELIFSMSKDADFETTLGLFMLRNTIARWKFDSEISAKNQQIYELQNSTSMKAGLAITAPLRKIKDVQVKHGNQNPIQHEEKTSPYSGLTIAKRVPQVIASFTSYPMRLDTIAPTVKTLASQTQKFDRIVLWLAKPQFPDQELPKSMDPLFDLGLEVMWCEQDIKSYKRSVCSFEAFPDDILVFFDDDLRYKNDCLETLLESYSKNPDAINAHRVRKIKFKDDGSLSSYPTWDVEHTSYIGEPRMDLLATNGGGTLYPPHIMPSETKNAAKFMQLAPTADDIWLKFMQVIANVPVVFASEFEELEYTDKTQEVCALYDDNAGKNLNDKAISNLLEEYNEFHGASDTLLTRMRN